jgi:hypothetical protein
MRSVFLSLNLAYFACEVCNLKAVRQLQRERFNQHFMLTFFNTINVDGGLISNAQIVLPLTNFA